VWGNLSLEDIIMPKFDMFITTTYTKPIEIEAEDRDQAVDLAWEWIEENDPLHNADVDTDVHYNGCSDADYVYD